MTIQEAINELLKVPQEKRNLPLYVCDVETNNNTNSLSVTLFDSDSKHDENNMLAINY